MIEVIGKNGAGKSYITNQLYKMGFDRQVGYTTRKPRDGEIDGVDYFFISLSEFESKLLRGDFVDYKFRNDHYYGIDKNNLTENSILVSGDSKKIEMKTGFNIDRVYLNSDIKTRYERVLTRKDTTVNNFSRFHSENFSFLYDFNAIFIDNQSEDDASIKQIVNLIESDDKKHIPNRTFLGNEIEKFDFEKNCKTDDKLLALLAYEEYLLRKLLLKNNFVSDNITKEEYYKSLCIFAELIGVKDNKKNKEGLSVKIEDQEYNFDYKEKRLMKK